MELLNFWSLIWRKRSFFFPPYRQEKGKQALESSLRFPLRIAGWFS
jgi:hypothetical protein